MNYKRNLGNILVALYLIIPTSMWLVANYSTITSISSIWNLMSVVGKLTAVWGLLLLFLNFILSTRAQLLDRAFHGLNNVYILHHQVGAYSLIFLLLHPMLSLGQYLGISLQTAFSFISLQSENIPVYLGIIALDLMIILLILTFFVSLKYSFWKKTHKLLGIVLIPASLHVIQISPTIQKSPLLAAYLFVFGGIAFIAYLYKTILWKYLTPYYEYEVTSVRVLQDMATEIVMKPIHKPMKFAAGQFVFIRFYCLGISDEEHPFSITAADNSDELSFCIKMSGDYTATLPVVKVGSKAKVQGPFGKFSTNYYRNNKQVWIAGGIGITPFLSMTRSLNTDKRISLFYVVKDDNELLYSQELSKLSHENPNFNAYVYTTKRMGKRITADYINEITPDLQEADIFICGPVPMMKSLKSQFKKLGLKGSQIHTEEFALN